MKMVTIGEEKARDVRWIGWNHLPTDKPVLSTATSAAAAAVAALDKQSRDAF